MQVLFNGERLPQQERWGVEGTILLLLLAKRLP